MNEEEQIPQEETAAAETAPAKKKKKRVLGNVIYFLLIGIFAAVFIACAVYIADYTVKSNEAGSVYNDLAARVEQARKDAATAPDATLPSGSGSTGSSTQESVSGILPEYEAIYELNSDLVGWITIPDTKIDYPVMQTPDTDDYYLYRNFDKTWSSWGCIYAREECDVFTPCDNVVLYGHHMKDGSMFASLDKYKKESFWKDHQTFTFDTLYEHHTYQVIAVFKTSANPGQGFSYHTFNYADSEEDFNAFISQVHALQMYDTGLTAQYGDMLLTLSTCEYTLDNGRFVVVAKRIS